MRPIRKPNRGWRLQVYIMVLNSDCGRNLDLFGIEASLSSMSGSSEAINVFQSNGSLGTDEWEDFYGKLFSGV